MLKFAYFGSPDFAADLLEKIIKDNELNKYLDLRFVITQKDKPVGRKQVMTPTPVKVVAQKYSIPVYDYGLEPRVSRSGARFGILKIESIDPKILEGIDLILVYAYGAIISKKIMDLPRLGLWNVHPSLLPKYRGTAPMATPLINGDEMTGVTIIKMDNKMDHGPIIAQTMYTIKNSDKRPDLEKKLTDIGFDLFKSLITTDPENLKEIPQDDGHASYTKKLKKDDGFIDFEDLKRQISESPEKLNNLYRGLYPWPGIWTILPNGKRLKITEMEYDQGKMIIQRVQLEGKNEVDFSTFNKTYNAF